MDGQGQEDVKHRTKQEEDVIFSSPGVRLSAICDLQGVKRMEISRMRLWGRGKRETGNAGEASNEAISALAFLGEHDSFPCTCQGS